MCLEFRSQNPDLHPNENLWFELIAVYQWKLSNLEEVE